MALIEYSYLMTSVCFFQKYAHDVFVFGRLVRRGDSGMPRPPFRRYAAVQEYIDKANIQKGANIVLLTDDESTIEEVRTYHNNDYNWIYLDRPRNRGIKAGFHGHFPSSDEGKEMAVIATELRVASTCENIVFGRSGFIEGLLQSMDAEGKNYTLHFLETKVSVETLLLNLCYFKL